MSLKTLRSIRMVHRIKIVRGTEYRVTLTDDPPAAALLTLLSQLLHHWLHLLIRIHGHHLTLLSRFSVHLLSFDGYSGAWCSSPSTWGFVYLQSLPPLCGPHDMLVWTLQTWGDLASLPPPLMTVLTQSVLFSDSSDPYFLCFLCFIFILCVCFLSYLCCVVQSTAALTF